jgi:cell division protein FtsB
VALAQLKTEQLKARNAKLESEVRDLREGTGAVEERARLELGMIKQNEIFVQVLPDLWYVRSQEAVGSVPEPTAPALIGVALLGLLAARRNKNKAS